MRNEDFEILPAGEMRAKYGLTSEARPVIKLNAKKIPEALRVLIPLAEQFGASDDLVRADIIAKAQPSEIEKMCQAVDAHAGVLDEWLAGAESSGPTFSDEYIVFTCLRMAADGC